MSRKSILLVFLLALSLRLLFWVFVAHHPERALENDSWLYLRLGEAVLDSHTFPSILRTPGYPFFISLVYAVFGEFPQAVLLLQCLLDSATAVIIALTFFRIFGNARYAVLSGFTYSVNPFAIFYSNMVLTETLFTFIFVSAISLFFAFLQRGSRRKLALSSVLLGIGTLCRPISFLVPVLLVPFIFFKEINLKKKLFWCAIFMMLYSTVLLPWYVRNDRYYGQWTLSTAGRYNIFVNFAPEVLMGKDRLFSLAGINIIGAIRPYKTRMWHIASAKYGWDTSDRFGVFDDPVRASILTEEGMKIIRADPLIFVASHTIGVGRVIAPFFPRFRKITGRDVAAVSLLSYAIDFLTMAFSLIGIVLSLKDRSREKIRTVIVINMIILIVYFAVIPGIEGGTRFRVPILPYVTMFSALGVWKSLPLLQRRKKYSVQGKTADPSEGK